MQFLEQLAKIFQKIGEFDPKSYYNNDNKLNSEQQVEVSASVAQPALDSYPH